MNVDTKFWKSFFGAAVIAGLGFAFCGATQIVAALGWYYGWW